MTQTRWSIVEARYDDIVRLYWPIEVARFNKPRHTEAIVTSSLE